MNGSRLLMSGEGASVPRTPCGAVFTGLSHFISRIAFNDRLFGERQFLVDRHDPSVFINDVTKTGLARSVNIHLILSFRAI